MKHIRKRVWGTLLCLAMLLSLLPTVALAGEVTGVKYLDPTTGEPKTCPSAQKVESSTEPDPEDPIVWSEAWYVVNGNVKIASRITVTGDVNLILADGCTLNAQKGIYVGSAASLTIYGQSTGDNAGELTARAYQVGSCAGIGGNTGTDAAHGNITINGGIITAESFGDAAAIGSGSGTGASGKSNGTITINGGTVTATARVSNGAGIGGGYANNIDGGDIVITGGTVIATGAQNAAGIGGGYTDYQKNGRKITITGTADVTATGGDNAAGIGCGYANANKSIGGIIINGQAKVEATGGENAAGIGGSYASGGTPDYDFSTGTIEWVNVKTTGPIRIGGSAKVTATGGGGSYGGAGIGAGGSGAAGDIYITGGTVNATGGACTDGDEYHGAGIGSGNRGVSGTITISAGVVTAESGGAGADGIGQGGSGRGGDFSTGTNGQAIIYASSITDTNTGDWSGIVFQGDDGEGQVYGTVTLREDLTLESGQTLTVPEDAKLTVPKEKKLIIENGATLIVEGKGNLTNNGTVSSEGTLDNSGTVAGSGAFTGDGLPDIFVAEFGGNKFKALTAAINAANRATGGGTVTLLKNNATLSTAMDEDVTLSVDRGKTLTVNDASYLAEGTLEIKVGGGLMLGANQLVGSTGSAINLTSGSVTMNNGTVTLTNGSKAEIPSGQTFYLMLGTGGPALDAVIAEDATLTVNGTLKAVSGSGESGSQVTVNGTLDVQGTLTIALQADVTVESSGTLNLPAMTKETMGSSDAGKGMKGDIIVKVGGKLNYSTANVLGGASPLMTLTEGSATLNLGNANADTNPSVSLTLNGKASVDDSTKALLLAADNGGTIVPVAISVAGTSEAVVSENGVLNLINGSSLTVADSATFTVDGILEVHSTAKFDGKATVSGKVYVFEANEEANPISGASITLTSTGAVYAEKTKLDGTTITPAHMTESTEKYTSTSSNVGEKTFANQWTLSYKITLDPNDGTLVGTTSELWTDANGKLTAMPSAPTRIGYTFQGWYNGDTKFDFSTPVTDNITLTAQWTINTYTVKFNSNGGSGSMAAQTFSYGTAQNLTANAFTRPGYTFAGWNTKVDGSGTPYGDKAELTLTDNLTLYAQWELIIPPFTGHSIAVITDGNGTASVNPTAAKGGETVTITATPEEGYEVGAITVTSVTGQSVAVTGNKFTMPAASVTVKVTFVKTGAPACPFTDVTEANWYYDEVYYVWANGLMQGTSATTFGPGVDTTRAMVVTILWRLEGEPASGYDMDYSDVAGGAWYADAVRWATEHGIVNGSEGQFYPGGTVTREQLAAMLYRYAQYKGYDLTAGGDLSGFADAGAVSGWAETSLAWAVGQRLIQGSANQIDPTGSAIRAQLAAILMRFCENVAEV